MSRRHEARRFRLSIAAGARLSEERLDALADNPRWADHHDIFDLIGEVTAGRMRRAPLPPVEDPRTEADVRRDPRVGDMVLHADGRPFAAVAAILPGGYVAVTVPDGHPLVWTVRHWGFQGVAGDRYVHVPGEEGPTAQSLTPPRVSTKGWIGQRADAHLAWEEYKGARKTLRRRRADHKAYMADHVLGRWSPMRDDVEALEAAVRRGGRPFSGRPRYNRAYREFPVPAPVPSGIDTEWYAPSTDETPATLADVWPAVRP